MNARGAVKLQHLLYYPASSIARLVEERQSRLGLVALPIKLVKRS